MPYAHSTPRLVAHFEAKATDREERTFEGLAATWELDLGGDVIEPGAFAKTLSGWRRSGRIVPLVDQHNYGTVRAVLGKMLDARETGAGLWTRWKVTEGQDGDELLHRLRGGYVDGLSIGYNAVRSQPGTLNGKAVRRLQEIELQEVSAVIFGMNPAALIDTASVKEMLEGTDPRTLTDAQRKDLRALASRIGNLLRPGGALGSGGAFPSSSANRLRRKMSGLLDTAAAAEVDSKLPSMIHDGVAEATLRRFRSGRARG
jgi:uncharacterized protein